jgi:glyoxylase-like metal-dependent hydrolase (beta-lactamase superfamily II)
MGTNEVDDVTAGQGGPVGELTEVAPGIHRVESTLGDRILCVYVLVGDHAALLVDTGAKETPSEVILPFLRSAKIPVEHLRYALISHPDIDHMGGNAAARQLFPGMLLACHERDRGLAEDVERIISERYERFSAEHEIEDPQEVQDWFREVARAAPIDLGLTGGETFRLSDDWHVQVLHTPGHSEGHLTLFDPRSRAVIVSDAVLGEAMYTRAGTACAAPGYYSVDPYLRSIETLQELRPELVLTAHFPAYQGADATAFLQRSRGFVDRLDAALESELVHAKDGHTTRELTVAVGRRLQLWPAEVDMSAVYPVMGHLERLLSRGRVELQTQNRPPTWRWV